MRVGSSAPAAAPPWHALEAAAVLVRLETGRGGLADDAVLARRQRYGANVIVTHRPDGPLTLLWRQLNSPLLFVLLGSGAVALLLGKVTDGAVVLGVVALNAIIGFVQEHRAQQAITALGEMVAETAMVRRAGRAQRVPAADVVPGDVVLLGAGDRVPADLRLLAQRSLRVDESALTGESVPVPKQLAAQPAHAELGDRSCLAHGGTMVTHGTGSGVVVATGDATELGRISTLLHQTAALETPLTRAMGRVSLWLTFVIVGVTALLFAVGWLRGYGVADATVAAIALAVAAIPEGLPAIITIALAIGVRRMARRRVIIRRLPAVETLGSTTVICSDKTGTLTKNEMTVQAIWTPGGSYQLSGAGFAPQGELTRDGQPVARPWPAESVEVLRAGALCNDAALSEGAGGVWRPEGDPTEVALVVAARKLGLYDQELRAAWPRLDAVPFESERQLMATLHRAPDGTAAIFIKGAPEAVIARCGGVELAAVRAALDQLAASGMRVLAMAHKTVASPPMELGEPELSSGFALLGLQGMSDPPRAEAREAVGRCRTAGIAVKMITGDHAGTARAVAQALGLQREEPVVTGAELSTMPDAALGAVAASAAVFARVAPEHKLRLVSALQAQGQVVAMTGDGVNDAPALKRADIGVAMGVAGTAASRQAADMVLTDDNFASIVAAVEEGRRVFDNLIKSLVFVLPTNIGEALVVLAAMAFFPVVGGEPLAPILPVQILWVNLVATVALALPLAFEAMEPNVMGRPPRDPRAPLLDGFVIARTIYVAVLMAGGAIGLFFYERELQLAAGAAPERALAEAQTAAVTSIVTFQVFYLLACRSLKRTIFAIGVLSNRFVFAGIAAILALQAAFVYLPSMNELFRSAPLGAGAWARALLVGAAAWPLVAVEKAIRRRREARVLARA